MDHQVIVRRLGPTALGDGVLLHVPAPPPRLYWRAPDPLSEIVLVPGSPVQIETTSPLPICVDVQFHGRARGWLQHWPLPPLGGPIMIAVESPIELFTREDSVALLGIRFWTPDVVRA